MTPRAGVVALAAALAVCARAEEPVPAAGAPATSGGDGAEASGVAPAAPALRLAALAEGTASAGWSREGVLPAGGRLTLRLGPLFLALSVDGDARGSPREGELHRLVLFGPGLVHDLSPHLSVHAALLLGNEVVELRDHVDGGWRSADELAIAARAGLEWRFAGRRAPRFRFGGLGRLGLHPVLGLSATVFLAGTGSDRLRDLEWGGPGALVTASLGLELSTPPRAFPTPSTPP